MPTCNADTNIFVNREKEIMYVKDKVAQLAKGVPFEENERVVYFLGPSGIGKSSLLDASINSLSKDLTDKSISAKFERLNAKGINEDLVKIDVILSNHLGGSIAKPKEESPQVFNESVHKSIHQKLDCRLGEKAFVLFIDEVDSLLPDERKNIEASMLAKLIENPRILIIMAGRTPVYWANFSLALKSTNTFVLDAFDEDTTGKQLEKLKVESKPVLSKIYDLGRGVPGNNHKLAKQLIGNPPTLPDDLQVAQSLLADIKKEIEKRFHPVIEAICILTNFHPDDAVPLLEVHPALGGKWDENRVRLMFTEFNKVRIGPGGLTYYDGKKRNWVIDEPTRRLFEQELRMRDPELWRRLHCKAYWMYKKWGNEFDSQLFKDKSIYHKKCLQSAGYTCDDLGNEA